MEIKKSYTSDTKITIFSLPGIATILVLFLAAGCASETPPEMEPNKVTITAVGLTFEAPDTIQSGWTTFQLDNQSDMIHFALFQKFPQGKGLVDHQEEIAPFFQNVMNGINGMEPADPEIGAAPPEWYSNVQMMGGPGLVSGNLNAETTFYIEPGTYLVECYVKTNGIFHSYNPSPDVYGMAIEITVTENPDATAPPASTSTLNISSEGGIEMTGSQVRGENVVEVIFEDQNTYANFVGHDVHLVRLDEAADEEAISSWMNWTSPSGLETPAPATFIAGTNEMPAGSSAYLHLNLEPGDYMWIAEVPEPGSKGMVQRFTIE
ncbi:hypothetical protein [Rhodohalobacter mucosus]|uniref:Uncharacterized protein n=1 Tax=Rhodohalobacter mucosus TaxID=2079485 RepID=A0A316TZ51_9BACT|nr:hypothetical protein [Rhodohalobacter mucosus]PWN08174.1 hypothetical protein DDZ15_00630 [Rhodohalobacter mucosus]